MTELPGLTPSVLAEQLGVARNALSFHLKELARAALVTVEPQGRNLIARPSHGWPPPAAYSLYCTVTR